MGLEETLKKIRLHMLEGFVLAGRTMILAACSRNTVGRDVWQLTDAGRKAIVTCYESSKKPTVLVQLRDVPVTEMNKYKLIISLDKEGWTMRVVSKKESCVLRAEEAGTWRILIRRKSGVCWLEQLWQMSSRCTCSCYCKLAITRREFLTWLRRLCTTAYPNVAKHT